jgi:hypothetical protein
VINFGKVQYGERIGSYEVTWPHRLRFMDHPLADHEDLSADIASILFIGVFGAVFVILVFQFCASGFLMAV